MGPLGRHQNAFAIGYSVLVGILFWAWRSSPASLWNADGYETDEAVAVMTIIPRTMRNYDEIRIRYIPTFSIA